MQKLEVIINDMMADEGAVPTGLDVIGAHCAKNDRQHHVIRRRAVAWKGRKAGTGSGTKGTNGTGTWNRGKGYDCWQDGKGDDGSGKGGKKVSNGGSVGNKNDRRGKDQGYSGSKSEGKGKGKTHSQYCHGRGEQGHIGVNCPYKRTNNVDEDDDQSEQGPSMEDEPEGEKSEGLAVPELPDGEGEGVLSRTTKQSHQVRKTM